MSARPPPAGQPLTAASERWEAPRVRGRRRSASTGGAAGAAGSLRWITVVTAGTTTHSHSLSRVFSSQGAAVADPGDPSGASSERASGSGASSVAGLSSVGLGPLGSLGGSARTRPSGKLVACQVVGCPETLRHGQAKPYLLRYRLCAAHLRACEVATPAGLARFCHKCSRFEALDKFKARWTARGSGLLVWAGLAGAQTCQRQVWAGPRPQGQGQVPGRYGLPVERPLAACQAGTPVLTPVCTDSFCARSPTSPAPTRATTTPARRPWTPRTRGARRPAMTRCPPARRSRHEPLRLLMPRRYGATSQRCPPAASHLWTRYLRGTAP